MSSQPGPHESQGLVALPLLWKDVSKLVESLCLRHFRGGVGNAPLIVWVDLLVQILGPLSGMFLRAPRWANRLHRPAFHSQINAVGASFSLSLWDIPLCHLLHNLSTLGVRPDIKPEHLIFFCIMA